MESLFLLIPLSLVIVAIAVWIFLRMSAGGQFDDMVGPAHSVLMDDDRPRQPARAPPAAGSNPDSASTDTSRDGAANTTTNTTETRTPPGS